MKRKLTHILGPLLALFLFTAALWALHHELKTYSLHDILSHLHQLPRQALLSALLLTVFSYLLMTGYDTLALRYIRHSLSYGKTALASFIGYTFSNNIGLSMITGASVRYRLYTAWGLAPLEIAQVIGFCTLTVWLGFSAMGGIILLAKPDVFSTVLYTSAFSARPVGVGLCGLVAGYLLWSFLRKPRIKIRGWFFTVPPLPLSFIQVIFASLDWLVAATVLYVLLPSTTQISYVGFICVFMMAQLAGLMSQIPGGLGVFETAVLMILSPALPGSEILGSLLAYRAIYYLLPLLSGALLLGIQETFRYRTSMGRMAKAFGRWMSFSVPQIMALTTFLGGAILLFSGATPALVGRLAWLKRIMPLPVIEISHFLGSLVGGGLLLLARGLQRRIDAAYGLTALLLAGGIVFSLLKGLDYEEAAVLAAMLVALLPCRKHFYRSASLFQNDFSPGWTIAIMAVLICSLWLGFFSYKHVAFSDDLWWRFTFSGNAPRFLRATVGVMAGMFFYGLAKLLRPATPRTAAVGMAEMERVKAIVEKAPRTYANLALLGDKSFLFSNEGNAFIMYGIEGRSWVSMGEPVGEEREWVDLSWHFLETSDRFDGWSVFYEVGSERLSLYLDLGLTLLKLGEEARVPLKGFSLEGGARKGLRYSVRKLEKEGCEFQMVLREEVPFLLPELRTISDAWLKDKHTSEKGFSLGFFDEEYLNQFPMGIIRKGGNLVAFANLWRGAAKEELSIDLMRHLPEAPNGVMEYLFTHLMLWGKTEGYRWFNLGMAPLSGLEDHGLAPLWSRVGAYVYRYGEHFYNFQGLRQYKEKFDPVWASKYLACPGGMAVPRILTNVASLISGGMRRVIVK